MITRIFRASNSIASAAVVLGLAGLFSRLLGVYRDRLLATTFGAGATLDVYYAAFRIPDFIFNLLVLGALSAGFIPVFSEYLNKSKEEAWRLAQAVLFVLFFVLIAVCALLFIFAPWLMQFLTPGFDQENITMTVGLTRIMLLSPILLGVSSVFGGILQSLKRFLAYSLAPIFYNLGIIFGIVVFVRFYGIDGLAWGVVMGSFLHLLMQLLVSYKLGWRWINLKFWQENGLVEVIRLMGPRTLALAITQINLVVITIIASGLQEGRLAIFTLAQNLAHVPIGLFGISFAVAAFPVLSSQYAEKKELAFSQTIYKTLTQILFFLFPSLVVFALLDEQIVRLVLGAGEFDWASTLLTARTLLYFIPGILAQALLPLFARAFYAQKNTRHPLYAAGVGLVLNAILGIWLAGLFGVIGLAMAFSLASLVQVILLMIWQFSKIPKTDVPNALSSTSFMFVASMAMLIAMQLVKHFSGPFLNLLTVKGVLVHFLLPMLVGGSVYFLVLKMFKAPEYLYFEEVFLNKIKSFRRVFLPVEGVGAEDDLL